MEYRTLGRTGLKVSSVSLGSWITFGGQIEDATAEACVHRAYELGINLFDTANVYERGAAEEVLGKALKPFRRDSYVLASKVYFPMGDGPNDRGLSRKHIMEQCHLSLKRLDTDYLDLYQCHRYDEETPLEETLRAMDDLVHQGKVLYWGTSQWNAAQLDRSLKLASERVLYRQCSEQPVYNMLNRGVEKEVLPLCAENGIGLIVYSPLAQGLLTGKYKPGSPPPADSRGASEEAGKFMRRMLQQEEQLAKVQRLAPIAEKLGLTLPQLALAWLLRRPEVSSVICGASRPSQVEDNVGAAGVTLADEVLAEIEAVL